MAARLGHFFTPVVVCQFLKVFVFAQPVISVWLSSMAERVAPHICQVVSDSPPGWNAAECRATYFSVTMVIICLSRGALKSVFIFYKTSERVNFSQLLSSLILYVISKCRYISVDYFCSMTPMFS